MKKYALFFIIPIIFMFSFSMAKAEEKEFTYEISASSNNLDISYVLEKIKNFFTSDVFARGYDDEGSTGPGGVNSSPVCGKTGDHVGCSGTAVLSGEKKMCSIKSGDNIDDNFENNCAQGYCYWKPKMNTFVCDAELFKINKATLTTTHFPEGNDDAEQCNMAVHILSDSDSGYTVQASPTETYPCVDKDKDGKPLDVSVDFNNPDLPSGAVKWTSDLYGRGEFPYFDLVGPWEGKLTLVGTRPSVDEFTLTGVDYNTKQSTTVKAGQTLNVCKNSSVVLNWKISDSSGSRVFIGSPERNIAVGNGAGIESFTPVVDSNVILSVYGFAGRKYKEHFYTDDIKIKLFDCQGEGVSLTANPSSLSAAGKSTLTWGSNGMESCSAVDAVGGWSGKLPDVNGSKEINVSETTTYKIQCRSALDHTIKEAQATVKVGEAGGCDPNNNDPGKRTNPSCSRPYKCCNTNTRMCEACQTVPTGTLDVQVRLNGVGISAKDARNLVFRFTGALTLERGAPDQYELAAATYRNFQYVSGGPAGSTFLGFSQDPVTLTEGQTSVIYMNFSNGDSALRVVPRLNGQEIATPIPISLNINGPQTINATELPKDFSNIISGTYNLDYVSGGPENSTFLGFSPSQSVYVAAGQTTTIYVDFTDGAGLCNITVQAIKTSCDGSGQSPWTGSLSYGLLGPAILNGMTVEQTFENIPSGRYYLTSLVGGPGTYNGVSPGNPIACPSGSNVTLQMRFKDCGETRYKCNYSTGACESCDTYSDDCKYNVFTDCKTQCSGCTGPHAPVSNVFCWANFDSDTCTGVNDNNANTPSVILYDKSSDECGDTESCHWKIYDSSGNLIKSADTCAPYPWYDETPGTYTGELTVTDSQGNSSTDRQKFIIKNIDTLTCNFVWDPTSPTASGVTSFFDQTLTPSGTSLKSWSWTFEGATPASSTAQNISNVKFNSAGAKTITLTVKNSANKTCTISKQIQVKTINPYWKEVIPD